MTITAATMAELLSIAGSIVEIGGQVANAVKVLSEQQAQGRDISEDERAVFAVKARQADELWKAALQGLQDRTKK